MIHQSSLNTFLQRTNLPSITIPHPTITKQCFYKLPSSTEINLQPDSKTFFHNHHNYHQNKNPSSKICISSYRIPFPIARSSWTLEKRGKPKMLENYMVFVSIWYQHWKDWNRKWKWLRLRIKNLIRVVKEKIGKLIHKDKFNQYWLTRRWTQVKLKAVNAKMKKIVKYWWIISFSMSNKNRSLKFINSKIKN
jgi:hypothetical protein